MGNKVVIFPVTKEASARAYAAWTDAQYKALYNPAFNWAYVRNDMWGQWVVPFLGPPWTWNGVEITEPEGGEAMRVDGVLHDFPEWPSDE